MQISTQKQKEKNHQKQFLRHFRMENLQSQDQMIISSFPIAMPRTFKTFMDSTQPQQFGRSFGKN